MRYNLQQINLFSLANESHEQLHILVVCCFDLLFSLPGWRPLYMGGNYLLVLDFKICSSYSLIYDV